ncbi:MAG: methylenetetrahydrofolate reductase [NAD(P)H] [Deltaproteobacteria bacterium]|nr:methylenetetrahydrofolate reductase [NAD(P)H] [Deltaproteobacteria bacterium]
MNFAELYSTHKRILSLEFFPPKQEAALSAALELIADLKTLNPDFMTVTYGAGGGTRTLSGKMLRFIANNLHVPAVAHLTCVCHSIEEINSILDSLEKDGIRNILALRGDLPLGQENFSQHPSGFSCARDLVRHIAKRGRFHIAVAGYPEMHPEATSVKADIEYLKSKIDAGAEIIITQLFFDSSLYFDFLARAVSEGINVPIVPGLMPIGNVSQIKRFTNLCKASMPDSLIAALSAIENDKEAVIEFGINFAESLARKLLDGGAPGIHLYTLNNSRQARPLIERLSDYFQKK